jgi:aromatic ring-opening dioxygenase catalytic subunit (LigB family)
MQIVKLLKGAGFKAEEDTKRNLDHGVFIPLKLV